MARIRSVKPDFWDDRKLAKATSRDARLLYIGLWNFADEHGRCNGDPEWLRGHLFAYDEDVTTDHVDEWLEELAAFGRLTRYVVGEDPFLFLPKLAAHQRLEPDKAASKIPAPEEANNISPQVRADLPGETAQDSDLPGETAPRAESPEKKNASLWDREHVAGSMVSLTGDASRPAQTRADSPGEVTGGTLIKYWIDLHKRRPPNETVGKCAKRVGALLGEGFSDEEIRGGLRLLNERQLDPSLLPGLVNEALNGGPKKRTGSAAALREYADQLRGEESA